MSVGTFPGFHLLNRRTDRAPSNPLDKSTIISIYPKKIKSVKVTLLPGRWEIPAGTPDHPSALIVGPSSWFKEVNLNEPLIEIPVSSIQIAESIIKDYINGIFGCDMIDSAPGLFFIPGAHSVNDIRAKRETVILLENAIRQQTNYYNTLVRFADSLWAESSGNPMVITDEFRLAARSLGIEDRDWMKDHQRQGMTRCEACGAMKHPDFPVCSSCRAVDMKHPKAKDLKFAQS